MNKGMMTMATLYGEFWFVGRKYYLFDIGLVKI